MVRRRFPFLTLVMSITLALSLVSVAACGGAEAPMETDTGAVPAGGDTSVASPTQPPQQAQSQPQAQAESQAPAQPAQPQGQSAAQSEPTAAPQPAQPVPFATRAPALLPFQVVDDPINKDVYADAQWGGILRRGGYYDPAHYDLLQVSSVTNSFKQMMLYNNVLRYNPLDAGKTIIPDLAASWEVSEDGHVWTFPLREGVTFHDGTILTADDVAASWSRVIDPPAGVVSARRGLYTPFGPSIEVIDPLTVQFTFEKAPPLNYGLNAFALEWHGVFPKVFLEEHKHDLKQAGQFAPSTGAFKYLEHQEGEVWRNERYENYWNEGLPYLDEVWTYPLENSTNRSAALLAGNVDYAQTIDPEAYNRMLDDERFVAEPFSSYSYGGIWFNMDKEPWNNSKVRKAMWLAFDRLAAHEIVSEWLFGYPGGGGWTLPDQAYQLPQAEIDARLVYDREAAEVEAQRLLAEAGYAEGIKNVDLLQRQPNSPWYSAMAQMADLEFNRILGIESTIRAVPSAVWFEELANRNFDITVGAIASPFIDPSAYMNSFYRCGGGENHSNYCNEEFDAIMGQVDTEGDFDKRYELVQEAARILDDDPPVVTWWYNRTLAAWRSCVHGLEGKHGALVHNLDRMDTVWMDEECQQ